MARLVKPEVIVNAAAHTAVDKAESEWVFASLFDASWCGIQFDSPVQGLR
jgi:dTDP-4-dehydrorhamnose reductase